MTSWEKTFPEQKRDQSMLLKTKPTATEALAADPFWNELHEEIGQLAELEEDWNDEGAPPIDTLILTQTQKFVQRLACELVEQTVSEKNLPDISPMIDGGVRLYWRPNGNQFSLLFRPHRDEIEIREKLRGAASSHRWISEEEAERIALQMLFGNI